ncbi:thioredoxin fold domain-containing protein [Alcanivorax sp. JB21]|uniref:thioredoxin fold domain-containing protein n=1 Tax=Alcanivorax limicola TaxID=2874102 RepID=UPI001CBA8584|nr:thioredoxin fold domain-containing protein [Alcanivorax limicola]MBZ2189570.1 thioredoxin fold domain-containing protein [Alcanivorax limicola]
MKQLFGVLLALTVAGLAFAGEDDARARIEASLGATGQPVRVTAMTPSDTFPGLMNVVVNGQERFLASSDGRYLIAGDVYAMSETGPVNVEDQRLEGVRRELFRDLDEAQMVTFKAAEEKTRLIVFTDPSCGYCRQMHKDMATLNAAGITVQYMAYPRAGAQSEPGVLMQQIWCASDRQKAMDDAKLRGAVRENVKLEDGAACAAVVAEQYALGSRAGVRGTPAVYTLEGRQMGGYMPPERLVEALGLGG